MMSIREQVIQYIKDKYRRTGEYKCTTAELKEYIAKRGGNYSINAVSTAIYQGKKDGNITELDGTPAGSAKNARYFTLTEILEEVTKPKSNITITQGEEMAEKKVPTQPSKGTPITVAANPFDKVNEQLKLISTQLQGLATGYSDLVKASSEQTNLTRNVDARYDQLLSLLNSAVTGINREESFSLNAINDLKQEIKQVEVPASAVAEAVNARLSDLRRDDSFIYRVREELDDRIHKTEENIQQHITNMLASIQIPSSVDNPNDYREGIKEGIRMAVEMELRSQKW